MTQKPNIISPRVLQKLACPKCHGELKCNQTEELLTCPACRLGYAIRQGVPVLLIDEAIETQ